MEGDQEPPLPAADSEASAAFVPEELPQEDMDFAQDGAEAGEDANLTMLDGEHAEEQRSRTPSDAAAQAALPFDPPESVRKWLRDEDWNALKKAWSDAESRAMSWEAGDVDDLDPGLWEDESGSGAGSSAAAPAAAAARCLLDISLHGAAQKVHHRPGQVGAALLEHLLSEATVKAHVHQGV
mmetsp:Transcript_36602/g.117654  ORF Transcript_36602/g.117654 Transcript_36602/m.117654 type:complete len:182 (-) Transcript_36602:168-713(-)